MPVFVAVSDGKKADVRVLDELFLEAGAFYVMDRGYADFARLYRFVSASAFYVTRAKRNLQFHRLEALPAETGRGVLSDQRIALRTRASRRRYPDPLRRVHSVDPATGKNLVFLTNHFDRPAGVIAALYKSRWRVELFFKWIKQNLRVRHFFGQSGSAVRTQIWIAIAVYVLVAIAKKPLGLERSLTSILQIVSWNVFSKEPLAQLLTKVESPEHACDMPN